jgi:hypothetical protein
MRYSALAGGGLMDSILQGLALRLLEIRDNEGQTDARTDSRINSIIDVILELIALLNK